MFCSNCGNKIEDNAKFCSSCGAVISANNENKNQKSNQARRGKTEKMSLGNTPEEKRETYEALTRISKKWGKVFAIFGVLFGLVIGGLVLPGTESIIVGVIIFVTMTVFSMFGYYWYGQIVYYGYLSMKVFFQEKNIGAGEIAGALGTSVLVSYIVGGKKSVKKLGVMWVVIFIIALTIGIFSGLYYYIKFQKEAKKLGFIQYPKMKIHKV